MAIPWSDDLISEQAYLVALGVRPMAWFGCVTNAEAQEVYSKFSQVGVYWENAIPFAVRCDEDSVAVGFAAEPWVIDLLKWIYNNEVPRPQEDWIIGLLLGYSPRAIAIHNARVFTGQLESNSHWLGGNKLEAETYPLPQA